MGKVILTSNGYSSDAIIEHIKKDNAKAVIIPTAHEQKEKSLGSQNAAALLRKSGYTIEFIDVEFSDARALLYYDLIFLAGGNPFYLMPFLKKHNAKEVFAEVLNNGGIISGASAGSMVLGTTIELPYIFTPELINHIPLNDFSGLGLVYINVCPHYNQMLNVYENFEQRIVDFEEQNNLSIIRLNDGEAIVYENDSVNLI